MDLLTRLRKKIVQLVAVSVLVAHLLLPAGAFVSAYALAPPPLIDYVLHYDLDTARGFEKEAKLLSPPFGDTPEFVLGRGRTGTMNVTFTSFEKNETIQISSFKYTGVPPWNSGWGGASGPYARTPDGITYSVEPANVTLPPGSKATVTLRIAAAPDAAIRSYNLTFALEVSKETYSKQPGYSTVLTIVEGSSSTSTNTNTTNITKNTTSCINQTVTTTVMITTTTTRTVTITSSNSTTRTITTTADLSVTTSNPATETVSTTFTSRTTAISTEQVAEPSIYPAAIGATAIAAVLAIVLLVRRQT